MVSLASIIIPIAPWHVALAQNAVSSALQQTLKAEVVTVVDEQQKGSGWARNRGAELANSVFLIFVDADDILEPTFLEKTVATWLKAPQPAYVYVDWYRDGEVVRTVDIPRWQENDWHPVTTLIPTGCFKAIGGFDEGLPGIEDKDLYLKLQARGVCGVRCAEPLLWYTSEGKRSTEFRRHPRMADIHKAVRDRYMGDCNCGKGNGVVETPADQQAGDVLVETTYTPMSQIGPVTGRNYPRPKGINGYRLWVDPRDAAFKPDWWQTVNDEQMAALAPAVDMVLLLAQEALRT